MKKILVYSAACLLALSSCDMDINNNPNYPDNGDVTPTLVFSSVENALATVAGDAMFTYGGFFAQYFEQRPESNQYNDEAELHFDEASNLFGRCYSAIYAGAMMDVKDIESKTTNPADLFACKVMTTLAMQYMVDVCGDAPYTEMCQGNANPTPKWEDGQTVYTSVLAAMDEAEAAIPETDTQISMTDPMFGQDLYKWKQFANALRLRMYMRLIDANVDAEAYKAKAKEIVASDALPDEDVTFDVYSNAEGQYNPWYGTVFSLTANNFCAAYPIVSYYNVTNDPRVSYAMSPASATGTYVGQIPGSKTLYKQWSGKDWKNKNVSTINIATAMSMPVYIVTLSEVEFLKAEVELRFNNDEAAAKADYEAAVKADFKSRGSIGAETFLTGAKVNFDDQATKEDKLKLIYMQKWAAFFFRNHMEAWSEQRRTDVPALSKASAQEVYNGSTNYSAGDMINPGLNYYGKSDLCKRLPYPLDARKYNKNTPAVKTLADPVFWDKE